MQNEMFEVGDVVKVRKEIGRRSRVSEIAVNSLGTTIYWLHDGGGFGASELELDYRPAAVEERRGPKLAELKPNERKALRYLGCETRGFGDLWAAAGKHKAAARAVILTDLLGSAKRIPQAQAGVTALVAAFYRLAGDALTVGDTCEAQREREFAEWAQALDVYRAGESGEAAAGRLGYRLGEYRPTAAEFACGDRPALERLDAQCVEAKPVDECACWNDPDHVRHGTYCDECTSEMGGAADASANGPYTLANASPGVSPTKQGILFVGVDERPTKAYKHLPGQTSFLV